MRCVRVWIKKTGRAKYISHLDMNRCFARAVRRAGINLWYTEGYNPRPYLNFLTPLSLGQESEAEPLELKIEDEMTNDEIFIRLSAVMPEGIGVAGVSDPVDDSNDIVMAQYEVTLTFNSENEAADFAARAAALLGSGVITAEKAGKKGGKKIIREINICESIHKCEITSQGDCTFMSAFLAAGNASSLNPTLLISALEEKTGIEHICEQIKRIKLLKEDYSDFR